MAETPTPEVTPTQTQVETPESVTPATDESLLGKTPEVTPEAEKPTEEKPKDEKVVPEKYEIKPPEGMEVDNTMLEKFAPVFKEIGLTNEQAQKLADVYAPYVKASVEAQRAESLKSYQGIVEGWKAEAQKAFGTELAKELGLASKAIDKLSATKEEAATLREFFNDTGVGNHPSIIRFFVNAGKKLGEDNFAEPNTQSTGSVSLYDHPTSKETLK